MNIRLSACILVGLAITLGGCQCEQPAKSSASTGGGQPAVSNTKPAAGADGKIAVVNAFCPMENEHPVKDGRVAADLVRMWRGKAVGFCCEDCPAGWDALSDADKDAALAKVVK